MGLGSCYTLLKYLVVIINLIFWLAGLAIVGVSIWLLTDPSVYFGITSDAQSYNSGIYVVLAIGVLLLTVGILGCCGAFKESQCLLISFFCILLLVVVAEIAAGAWAYTNQDKLKEMVKDNVKYTVNEEYSVSETRTITFDTIQHELKCCGANGPSDWAGSIYNKKREDKLNLAVSAPAQFYQIPATCCRGDPDDVLCTTGRNAQTTLPIAPIIYTDGCITKLYDYLRDYSYVILGIGIGIAILELLGLIFSLILCCAVRFVDRYKA